MDSTKMFDGYANDYTVGRPSYAAELIDCLYNKYGFSKSSIIADIGSGTGKFAKHLLDRGSQVYCVEPNDDMRDLLLDELRLHARSLGRRQCNIAFLDDPKNVSGITDFDGFADRVEEQIRLLKSSPKAEGVEEILVAGEPEARKYREALEHGVDIPPAVLAELREFSDLCGVPFDCEA